VIIAVLLKPLHRHSEAGISTLIDWLVGGEGRSETPPPRGGHLHLPAAGSVGMQEALVSFYRTYLPEVYPRKFVSSILHKPSRIIRARQ
jgi:hypothetical protein